MEFLNEKIINEISIPTFFLDMVGPLVGILLVITVLIAIDQSLRKLTQNRISLEIIFKSILLALKQSIQLPPEIRPLPVHRNIKITFACVDIFMWGSIFLIFLMYAALFILLILNAKNLPIDKMVLALGILFMFLWASIFAYNQIRISYFNLKSIR